MKKKHLILSAVLALASVGAIAAPVTKDRAVTTATTFLKAQAGVSTTVASVYSASDAYYIVNLKPQGWVIVSADDAASPIIGYSKTGNLTWHSLPENMQGMLDNYSKQVKYAASQIKTMNQKWTEISSLKVNTRASGESIDPLIRVHWDQSTPFNKYCPGTGSNKAIVGCVAVAMSQAMSVQQYPPRPAGQVNYTPSGYSNIDMNFDAQKAYDWNAIMSGANSYDEAARLLYHAGVSVRMRYGANSSGVLTSQLYLIRDALKNNFGYGSDVNYYNRDQYEKTYNQQAWVRLLINELTAGRAIIYNGTSSAGGHSFNIDGYEGGTGMFHLNWGWSGIGDGYFALNNLMDSYQGINFTEDHTCVIGIGSPNRELRSVEINAVTIEEGLPAGTIVANVTVNGAEPKPSYKFSVRGMYENGAFRSVPFAVENGKLVTTKQLSVSEKASYDFDIIVETAGENPLAQSFTITVEPWKALAAGTSVKYDRASGNFVFQTKHNVSYTLKSANGALLQQGNLTEFPSFTISKATLAAGKNTLELRRGNETKTLVLIK